MRSISTIIAAVSLVAAAPLAPAAPIATQSAVRGVSGSGLAGAAPGNPFALDFRPYVADAHVPYQALQVSLIFDGLSTQFATFNVQLAQSPEVFSFLPYPGNQKQVAYTLYDETFNQSPGVGYQTTPVFVPLPQAWRDELADGVLTGRLWVSNPAGGDGSYLFSVSSAFAMPEASAPEPSAGLALAATSALLLCRHGRRR